MNHLLKNSLPSLWPQAFSYSQSEFKSESLNFSIDSFLSQSQFTKFQLNGEVKGYILCSISSTNSETRSGFQKLLYQEFLYGINEYLSQFLLNLEISHDIHLKIEEVTPLKFEQVENLIEQNPNFQIKNVLKMNSYQNTLTIYNLGYLHV